jgi:GAF domain-containing protein
MDDPYSLELTQNLNELHELLLSEETLDSTLQRVAQLASASVAGCDSAGVTIAEGAKAYTAAATDEFTLKIDHDQYQNDEGPCLEALSRGKVVAADDIGAEARWPGFVQAAAEHGLGSVLSLPLTVRDETMGALNLYSKSTASFSEDSRPVGVLFAKQASVAISNAHVYASALKLADQLREGIKTREVIGEAKGILMAKEHLSDEQAFDMLRRMSQHLNIKLRDIARKLVDETEAKGATGEA